MLVMLPAPWCLANINSFASSKKSMGCWSSKAFGTAKVISRLRWTQLSCRVQDEPPTIPDVSVVSKVVGELLGRQLVKGHQLPCHRDLCQSVACHQDGGGSHKAQPHIPAALVWVGQLLQI